MASVEFLLERESANDESATVVGLHVVSGQMVAKGAPVLDIETSKLVKEIQSPADGIVRHSLSVGDLIEFGAVVFYIDSPGTAGAASTQRSPGGPASASASTPEVSMTPRVTARARALAEASNVDLSLIAGQFITVEHVRRHLYGRAAEETTAPLRKMMASSARPASSPLSASALPLQPAKRREIQNLQRGAGQSMLSVVGKDLGPFKRQYADNAFFADKIIDIVAYEASRLLQQAKRLNAAFNDDESVTLHSDINAGIAVDDDKGLMVYSVKAADQLALHDIQSAILAGLEKYLSGELSSADVSSATFTITDLSALEIDHVLPLLPRGHSLIIGITRSARRGYSLYAGFDHRITEGREASRFLSELCDRVLSFGAKASSVVQAECSICGKSLREEIEKFRRVGLLRVVDARGNDVLVCHNCDGGY